MYRVRRIRSLSILELDVRRSTFPVDISQSRRKSEGGILGSAGDPGGFYSQHLGRFKVEKMFFRSL